jgi:hypothetical protein
MNSIKTYLLPLLFLLFGSLASFAQTDSSTVIKKLSKTDSILVNCYFSEQDYNAIYEIENFEEEEFADQKYSDEIYSDQEHKKRRGNTFWENVPAELVVDVLVNTIFLVALLWQ